MKFLTTYKLPLFLLLAACSSSGAPNLTFAAQDSSSCQSKLSNLIDLSILDAPGDLDLQQTYNMMTGLWPNSPEDRVAVLYAGFSDIPYSSAQELRYEDPLVSAQELSHNLVNQLTAFGLLSSQYKNKLRPFFEALNESFRSALSGTHSEKIPPVRVTVEQIDKALVALYAMESRLESKISGETFKAIRQILAPLMPLRPEDREKALDIALISSGNFGQGQIKFDVKGNVKNFAFNLIMTLESRGMLRSMNNFLMHFLRALAFQITTPPAANRSTQTPPESQAPQAQTISTATYLPTLEKLAELLENFEFPVFLMYVSEIPGMSDIEDNIPNDRGASRYDQAKAIIALGMQRKQSAALFETVKSYMNYSRPNMKVSIPPDFFIQLDQLSEKNLNKISEEFLKPPTPKPHNLSGEELRIYNAELMNFEKVLIENCSRLNEILFNAGIRDTRIPKGGSGIDRVGSLIAYAKQNGLLKTLVEGYLSYRKTSTNAIRFNPRVFGVNPADFGQERWAPAANSTTTANASAPRPNAGAPARNAVEEKIYNAGPDLMNPEYADLLNRIVNLLAPHFNVAGYGARSYQLGLILGQSNVERFQHRINFNGSAHEFTKNLIIFFSKIPATMPDNNYVINIVRLYETHQEQERVAAAAREAQRQRDEDAQQRRRDQEEAQKRHNQRTGNSAGNQGGAYTNQQYGQNNTGSGQPADAAPGDYYTILAVAREATADEIKKSYRKMVVRYHPDNLDTGNEAKFKEITRAYEVLSNADKKAVYDMLGRDFFDAMNFR